MEKFTLVQKHLRAVNAIAGYFGHLFSGSDDRPLRGRQENLTTENIMNDLDWMNDLDLSGLGERSLEKLINDLQRRFGDKAAGPRGNTTNPLGRDPYGPIRLHLIGPDGAPVDKITCSLSKWSADNIGEFINEDWELKKDLEVTCVAFSGNILTFCISNGEELQVWLPVGGLRMMIGAHVKSFKIRLYCY